MKDTSENCPSSQQQAERPPTTNDRPHTTRHSETRPLTSMYRKEICRLITFYLMFNMFNLVTEKIREVIDFLFALCVWQMPNKLSQQTDRACGLLHFRRCTSRLSSLIPLATCTAQSITLILRGDTCRLLCQSGKMLDSFYSNRVCENVSDPFQPVAIVTAEKACHAFDKDFILLYFIVMIQGNMPCKIYRSKIIFNICFA